jgi:hypothetical protein
MSRAGRDCPNAPRTFELITRAGRGSLSQFQQKTTWPAIEPILFPPNVKYLRIAFEAIA